MMYCDDRKDRPYHCDICGDTFYECDHWFMPIEQVQIMLDIRNSRLYSLKDLESLQHLLWWKINGSRADFWDLAFSRIDTYAETRADAEWTPTGKED